MLNSNLKVDPESIRCTSHDGISEALRSSISSVLLQHMIVGMFSATLNFNTCDNVPERREDGVGYTPISPHIHCRRTAQ